MKFPIQLKRRNKVLQPKPRVKKSCWKMYPKQEKEALKRVHNSYDYENAQELSPSLKTSVRSGTTAYALQRVFQDTFTAGVIAGVIGTVVMHLSSLLWKSFGLIDITTMMVSGQIFLNLVQANTTIGFIVSAIAHLMVGSAGGVLLAYFIMYSGKDFYWLKGLGLAGFMLLTGMGLVVDIMRIVPQMRSSGVMVLLHMISYLFYGLTASFIIYRYGRFKTAE